MHKSQSLYCMLNFSGLSTITEEPLIVKEAINRRKVERARRISKRAVVRRPTSQIGLPYVGTEDCQIHCGSTSCEGYSKFSPLDVISF